MPQGFQGARGVLWSCCSASIVLRLNVSFFCVALCVLVGVILCVRCLKVVVVLFVVLDVLKL